MHRPSFSLSWLVILSEGPLQLAGGIRAASNVHRSFALLRMTDWRACATEAQKKAVSKIETACQIPLARVESEA
jgi:hypothetical protein